MSTPLFLCMHAKQNSQKQTLEYDVKQSVQKLSNGICLENKK